MLKIKGILIYFGVLLAYLMTSCSGQEGPRVLDCNTLKDCRVNQNCEYNSIDTESGVCSNRIPCKSDGDCFENMVCTEDGENKYCGTRNVFSIIEQVLPDAPKGKEYSFSKFKVENNNFTSYYFEIRSDTKLPQGLSLTTDGEIKGIPTANVGEYSFVVVAYNGPKDSTHYYNYRTAVKEFKINIIKTCDKGYIGENCDLCDAGYHKVGNNCVIDEVCNNNSCTETHKTTCDVVNGIIECSCDDGFHSDPNSIDECIIDEVCEQDSCSETNKTVCNIVNGAIECSCDNGFHPNPNSIDECIIDEVCEQDSCSETNKTVCNIVNGEIECSCDDGYHPDPNSIGECIIDEVCEQNSCIETNKTVCNIIEGMIKCSCDNNYHDVNGTCVKNPMIDWCNTQWPKEVTENNVSVYGRVYAENITSIEGASSDIFAQLCYYRDGETSDSSICVDASYSKDVNTTNRDEYKASLSFTESGIYHYYYQFKIGNNDYKKCDLNDDSIPIDGTNYENGETYSAYVGNANVTILNPGVLFISEYIEGKGDDKFIELYAYNGNVNLLGWTIKLAKNDSSEFATPINLNNVNLVEGTTFVLSNTGATGYVADQKVNNLDFNGNDAVGLFNPEGELVDLIGVPGDEGYFAKDKRLIRKPNINYPSTIFDSEEWIPTSVGGVGAEQDNLGVHVVTE